MKNKLYFILILSTILLGSCSSPTIETFFIEKGVTQYFISPAEFTSDNVDATIDFTLRTSEKYPEVTCNFSIFYEDINLGSIDKAYFLTGKSSEELKLDCLAVLFVEITKNKVRYTGILSKKDFKNLFTSYEAYFVIVSDNNSYKMDASSGFYSLKEDIGNKLVPHLE